MPSSSLPITVVLALGLAAIAQAEPKIERITLQITGDACAAQQDRLRSSLSEVEGFRSIDFSSIPEHVLVDVDPGLLSRPNLVETVHRLLEHERACRVELMQSCISADPFGQSGRLAADHATAIH